MSETEASHEILLIYHHILSLLDDARYPAGSPYSDGYYDALLHLRNFIEEDYDVA